MSTSLFESRLDNTVDVGNIGIGETVEVRTRMGVHVSVGDVVASTPFGLALNDGAFYQRDMYLFAPIEEEQPIVVMKELVDMSPDERVLARLAQYGDDIKIVEADSMDDKATMDNEKEDGDKKDLKKDKGEKKETSVGLDKEPVAKPESSVDVDNLPDDIKKAVISTDQMNDDQLNSVLSEIGDAATRALKRANINDPDVYDVVSDIQASINKILTSPRSGGVKKKG